MVNTPGIPALVSVLITFVPWIWLSCVYARLSKIEDIDRCARSAHVRTADLTMWPPGVGYIELPTGPRSHRDYVAQWVVLDYYISNQQKICLVVRQLTLTDFVTGISGALSPRHALP